MQYEGDWMMGRKGSFMMLDARKWPQTDPNLSQKPPFFGLGGAAHAVAFLWAGRAQTNSIFSAFQPLRRHSQSQILHSSSRQITKSKGPNGLKINTFLAIVKDVFSFAKLTIFQGLHSVEI